MTIDLPLQSIFADIYVFWSQMWKEKGWIWEMFRFSGVYVNNQFLHKFDKEKWS